MVAILEVPALRQRVAPMSVEHYESMGEQPGKQRTELIRGVLIEKITISPLHSFLVARLYRWIQSALPVGMSCRQEQPLRLKDSMPEPDLAVVTGQEADHRRAHPASALLALEVAVSSVELDHEKAALYAEANVLEYWIVLALEEEIEVYTAPVDGLYTQQRVYRRGETVQSEVLPMLRVELGALFAG